MKRLLVISSAPVIEHDGYLTLDAKYVEGMHTYCDLWDGTVSGVLMKGAKSIPFSTKKNATELPFDLMILQSGATLSQNEISSYDAILAGGDNHQLFYLAKLCQKTNTKLFFIIENILETRIKITFLDETKSFLRKVYSTLWTAKQELRRKSAFRLAAGLQANGYPAFDIYRKINKNTILYLDNRMATPDFAKDSDIQAKKKHLLSGGPLRIIHSGRLEAIKGTQDLIPIARKLVEKGVDFELNIYGTGNLEGKIASDIIAHNLQNHVFLHAPVDFKNELVPISIKESDVFLSCHRQSDPSCTYVESMACGLAIFGYHNRMFSALLDKSNAGWAVPLGNVDALAEKIIEVNKDRNDIFRKCKRALEFSKLKSFEIEFERRIKQITDAL